MTITRRIFMAAAPAAIFCTSTIARAQGERAFVARKGTIRVQPDPAPESDVLTFGDAPFGASLRVRLGEEVRLRLVNETEDSLALHWRGLRIPNAFDGAPPLTQKPLGKGESFDMAFTPPDAGVFLFHPSVRAHANAQFARGLAGLLVVEERDPPPVDLDLECLVADWRENESEPIVFMSGSPHARRIDLPPRARIRLRLASASTRRVMAVGVDGARAQVAAIDGQPCALFEPVRQTLPLIPGGRYDVFFDLPETEGATASLVLRGMSGAPGLSRPLAIFTARGEPRSALSPLAALPANPRLPERIPLEKSRRVDLTLDGAPGQTWRINGQPASEAGPKPAFSVKRGTAVTLGFVNKGPTPQLMHVHGHAFRQIHLLDDGWEPYWRDSLIVPEGRTIRTAFVADNPGKWLIAGGFGAGDGPVTWFEVA